MKNENLTFRDFYTLFKKSIHWNSKEEDSLKILFEDIAQDALNIIPLKGNQAYHSRRILHSLGGTP